MPDKNRPDDDRREEPSGTTLTVEEWIELMNKHDSLTQYAKERQEKSDDE